MHPALVGQPRVDERHRVGKTARLTYFTFSWLTLRDGLRPPLTPVASRGPGTYREDGDVWRARPPDSAQRQHDRP